MSGSNRNEPCPCGSGGKAKKCCLKECCEACLYSDAHRGAVQGEYAWVLKKSLVRQGVSFICPCARSL